MNHRIPTQDELTQFLDRMISEARSLGDTDRMNDLLDKRANVDHELAFLHIVLTE